ncbi:MAG: hypothetical protein IJA62_03930 [Ruminococcus sp.]|nr:hypothetical protein [Ruminococcus sp.]
MSTIRLTVDTERLHYDVNEMEIQLQGIEVDMSVINQEINALGTMWSGQAKETLSTSFNESFEAVMSTLERFGSYLERLETDKNEYNNCEASVTSLVQGI